jgi:hypothetical protein
MRIRTQHAIDHFGSVAELAARLEITREAIYQWGEFVPEPRAYKLHVISGGALNDWVEEGLAE